MEDKNSTAEVAPEKVPETKVPEQTFGEKAVRLSFNPSGDSKVEEVKKFYAGAIDALHNIRTGPAVSGEKARLISIAITEAQGACMWAVSAVTCTE